MMRKFMRTRASAEGATHPPHTPHAPHTPHYGKTNGHAPNGVCAGQRDDQHSTLSRYWSGSEASSAAAAAAGALFEDAAFPAAARALGDRRAAHRVLWLRPHELCAQPRFRGDDDGPDGVRDDDDDQLADRWSVEAGALSEAAVCRAGAALALTPRLLDRAVPRRSFRRRYTGAFTFRFWVFGAWRDVTVDDRLPARAARHLGARSAMTDDFTLPLLEKAYAKLYGSYAALRGGSVARALQELSGGVVQSFSLRRQARALTFQVLNSAVPRSTLLVALAARARDGLVPGQPYCVTGLARVRGAGAGGGAGGGAGALVRVRAAGGRGAWAGAWAPHSAEWRALAPHDRDLLAPRDSRSPDFWMSFDDFAEAFTTLELVHVAPDDWLREPALQPRRPWRAVLARRRWRRGYNAGGPPAATETTGANPQFQVCVGRGAAGVAGAGGGGKCHVVVSVTQQYEPGAGGGAGGRGAERLLAIGFAVYELPAGAAPPRAHQAAAALRSLRALDVTHECRAREVATFFTLPAGRYLVVPHTRRKHAEAAFLLRIFTDEQTDVWEVNDDNTIVRDVMAEFLEEPRAVPADVAAALARLRVSPRAELDAAALRRALRAAGAAPGGGAVCRALLPLRDARLAGGVRGADVPALLALLAEWRAAWRRAAPRCGRAPALRLRALLWAAGVTVSNKVLEGLVLRFARRAHVSEERYVLALARLHLAHARHRALDARSKANPLSLEEMILMTIYS